MYINIITIKTTTNKFTRYKECQQNLYILNEDKKKKTTKKMPLFAKNVVHFEIFTNEMECERGLTRFE